MNFNLNTKKLQYIVTNMNLTNFITSALKNTFF